jgi:hypothetical protein
MVFPLQQSRRFIAVQLSEGETRTLDISLAPGAVVTGEVKDALSGAPIAGAEVSTLGFLSEVAQTDDAGRYEILGVSLEDSEVRVAARAKGYGRFEVQVPSAGGAEGSVLRADFELVRGRVVKGRVVSTAPTFRPLSSSSSQRLSRPSLLVSVKASISPARRRRSIACTFNVCTSEIKASISAPSSVRLMRSTVDNAITTSRWLTPILTFWPIKYPKA